MDSVWFAEAVGVVGVVTPLQNVAVPVNEADAMGTVATDLDCPFRSFVVVAFQPNLLGGLLLIRILPKLGSGFVVDSFERGD